VLPGALVYAVSVQFIGRSIESWFDVRVDRALEGGLNVGRAALDSLLKDTADKAGRIALALSETSVPYGAALGRAGPAGAVPVCAQPPAISSTISIDAGIEPARRATDNRRGKEANAARGSG